jgi:hypothetical protein
MGNVAIGVGRRRRRWPEVEERLTQPRRLLRQLSDVDSGRLRRLIRSGDLAPCFDAAEDDAGLDEDCPICFYVRVYCLLFPSSLHLSLWFACSEFLSTLI